MVKIELEFYEYMLNFNSACFVSFQLTLFCDSIV